MEYGEGYDPRERDIVIRNDLKERVRGGGRAGGGVALCRTTPRKRPYSNSAFRRHDASERTFITLAHTLAHARTHTDAKKVGIYWVDNSGGHSLITECAPGKEEGLNSYVGHHFVAKSMASGGVLAHVYVGDSHARADQIYTLSKSRGEQAHDEL